MDAYFSHLDHLEHQGDLSADEVSLLRVDLFARTELMELTYGEKSNLCQPVIETIRQRIRADSVSLGIEQGKREAQKAQSCAKRKQQIRVCKQAESEIEFEFKNKEKKIVCTIRIASLIIAIILIATTVWTFNVQASGGWKIVAIFATAIPCIQSVLPFLGKDTWPIRKAKQVLQRKKEFATDKRKEKYLSILDTPNDNGDLES